MNLLRQNVVLEIKSPIWERVLTGRGQEQDFWGVLIRSYFLIIVLMINYVFILWKFQKLMICMLYRGMYTSIKTFNTHMHTQKIPWSRNKIFLQANLAYQSRSVCDLSAKEALYNLTFKEEQRKNKNKIKPWC